MSLLVFGPHSLDSSTLQVPFLPGSRSAVGGRCGDDGDDGGAGTRGIVHVADVELLIASRVEGDGKYVDARVGLHEGVVAGQHRSAVAGAEANQSLVHGAVLTAG